MDLIDAPLTIGSHLRRNLAIAGKQLPTHRIEMVICPFSILFHVDSLGCTVYCRSTAAEEDSGFAITGPAARDGMVQITNGCIDRNDRECWSLVEYFAEGVDDSGILNGKCRPVHLCAGDEPTRGTRSYSGHE
jgi:hypothetical protein